MNNLIEIKHPPVIWRALLRETCRQSIVGVPIQVASALKGPSKNVNVLDNPNIVRIDSDPRH
jgi:hypothetical protein